MYTVLGFLTVQDIHNPTIIKEIQMICLEEWSKIYYRKCLSAVIQSKPPLNINGGVDGHF